MGYTPHVLVIGGGVTGTGIARDLAIRGLDVTLVERSTLTAGTTGRNLGILYSGARTDGSDGLARTKYRESRTLREIASHCIESTGGLLVSHEEDDGSWFDEMRQRIESRSIPHEVLDGGSAQGTEPSLSETVERAISVPDAVVDPSRLTVANAKSAQEYGATIRTHTSVTDITVDGGTIDTATLERKLTPAKANTGSETSRETRADGGRPGSNQRKTDGGRPGGGKRKGAHVPGGMDTSPSLPDDVAKQLEEGPKVETEEIDPDYIVNAAGPWARAVADLAGLDVELAFTAGTLTTLGDNPVETVVTRCHPDETTVAPSDQHAILGATAEEISDPDDAAVSEDGIGQLLDKMSTIVPAIEDAPQLRAYAGVQSSHPGAEGEHEHRLIDHGNRDDCWGMTTVTGGSLTTHRFVAERVVDDVCRKFGIQRECKTTDIPLPGSKAPQETHAALEQFDSDDGGVDIAPGVRRLGDRATDVLDTSAYNPVVCDCQSVTRAEIRDALEDETAGGTDIDEVRIRTSATSGNCQGGRCAHRIAAELYPDYDGQTVTDSLESFLEAHWGGQRHVLSGTQFERVMRTYILQIGTMNLTSPTEKLVSSKAEDVDDSLEDETRSVSEDTVGLAAFDDGATRQSMRTDWEDRPPWGERPQ